MNENEINGFQHKRMTMEEVIEQLNKTLFPDGRIKPKQDIYHFHKDCKYYYQCSEEIVNVGKQKRVRFSCPMLKYPQLYVPRDLHSIKWECVKFEPYQIEMEVQKQVEV